MTADSILLSRCAILLMFFIGMSHAQAQQSAVSNWEAFLKPKFFPAVTLVEDKTVIDLETPYRAEDAAFTPVRIKAMIEQTPERYIEKIHLIVDGNPEPLAGVFSFTPDIGRADLAFRIRVDRYTNLRAIAVLNTGEHHMVSNFVKAQGGCSIPSVIDFKSAMANLGKLKLRTLGSATSELGIATQLLVRHPNFTGMQMDYKIYAIRPAHYVKTIRVLLGDTLLMTAETGISISEDPSFRFFLKPNARGELIAEITDSRGEKWRQSINIGEVLSGS